MTLRYGMQLPIQAQSTFFVEPWEQAADRDDLAAVVRSCEAADFDYVAVCDHVAIPRDKADAMSTTWFDTVATLAWIAGLTERVRLLSHVYVPAYRHPLVTAKAWATLDWLSGGRAILGVGAGHVEAEFAALGVAFEDRGRLTDEAIDQVRALFDDEWAAGELGQRPRPVQQLTGIPIWVGGSSPAALRRAAERGDGWLPQGTPKKEMPDAVARIHAMRERAGRTGPFTIGAITPFLWVGEPTWDTGQACLAGTPERIAGYLQGFAAMGVGQVQVRFRSRSRQELCDQITAFGAEVGPLLDGR